MEQQPSSAPTQSITMHAFIPIYQEPPAPDLSKAFSRPSDMEARNGEVITSRERTTVSHVGGTNSRYSPRLNERLRAWWSRQNQTNLASKMIPSGLSPQERACYETLLKVVDSRPPRPPNVVVVITDLAKDYDDLAAMVVLRELDRIGVVKLLPLADSLQDESDFDRRPQVVYKQLREIWMSEQGPKDDASATLGVLDAEFRNRRRGRGPRRVIGLNGSDDPSNPEFFTRDFEFRSKEGSPSLARCKLDSQCDVPLLVSMHWAEENGKVDQISNDFKDHGMMSVSGHPIQADGILRNMVFNLKGSTVTFRRDVLVCGQLDGWTDMVAGAKFIAKEFAILFSKAKKMFAGIFSFKKETPEEKLLKEQLQYEAHLEFQESERRRRERQATEQREREEARRRRREAEAQMARMAENGQGADHH